MSEQVPYGKTSQQRNLRLFIMNLLYEFDFEITKTYYNSDNDLVVWLTQNKFLGSKTVVYKIKLDGTFTAYEAN